MGKRWTRHEYEYILDNWGSLPVKTIARYLNRTENAVLNVAYNKLHLKAPTKSTDMMTVPELAKCLNISDKLVYRYIYEFNLSCKKKKLTKKKTIIYISIDDFWKWAEQNKDKIDFSIFEKYSLGYEPSWVQEERMKDRKYKIKKLGTKTKKWTKEEVDKLIQLVYMYKYTYDDIAKMLGRTVNSIDTKLRFLNIKARPIRNNIENKKWTEEEICILIEMIKKGYCCEQISECIKRSQRAIASKILKLKKQNMI